MYILPVQTDNSAADDQQANSKTTKSDPNDECSWYSSHIQTKYNSVRTNFPNI